MTDTSSLNHHLDRSTSQATPSDRGNLERRDFLGDLTDAVRDNPLPAALIGMGILWMFSGGSKTSLGEAVTSRAPGNVAGAIAKGAGKLGTSVMHGAGSLGSSVAEVAHTSMEAVSDAAGRVGHALSSYSSDDRDPVHGYRASEGDEWDEDTYSARRYGNASSAKQNGLQQRLSAFLEERPLVIGAAGLALGAGIAASFPVSSAEKQTLGKVSDQLMNKVSDVMGQAKDMAAAAADEVEAQGISTHAVRDGIRSVASKIGE